MTHVDAQPIGQKWAVVILAAGGSRRMGRAKQLVEVDGEQMVRRALKTALASKAAWVVLVTGAYGDAVVASVADLAAGAAGRLRVVDNPEWAAGQAGSMQTGLAALPEACGAAIFLPVDQPYMQAALLQQLAEAWQAGAMLVAPLAAGELRGPPAHFDRTFWPELDAVKGDMGGRGVLRAHAEQVQTIAAPAAWLRDVDTPEDLAG
jgi:CTP:molybdopterin cytidylyltransferase MocA